jgi:hypothetical protein
MASKSKGFGKPLHQKEAEESQRKNLEKLAKKLSQSELGNKSMKMVINPSGVAKMSEVLEDFIEPYLEFARDHQQRQHLFEIAVMAWNLALLPADERQAMMDQTIAPILASQMALIQHDFQDIVDGMIRRKLDYFAENKRFIVSFELKDAGRSFQLLVASTAGKAEQNG